jgi:hypothetical protein
MESSNGQAGSNRITSCLPTIRDSPALRHHFAGDGTRFLHGRPLHNYVADVPPLVFAGLV